MLAVRAEFLAQIELELLQPFDRGLELLQPLRVGVDQTAFQEPGPTYFDAEAKVRAPLSAFAQSI